MGFIDKLRQKLNEWETANFWKRVDKDNETPPLFPTEEEMDIKRFQDTLGLTLAYFNFLKEDPKQYESDRVHFSDDYALIILKKKPVKKRTYPNENAPGDFIQRTKAITGEDGEILFLYDIWRCFEIHGKHLEDYLPANTVEQIEFAKNTGIENLPKDQRGIIYKLYGLHQYSSDILNDSKEDKK